MVKVEDVPNPSALLSPSPPNTFSMEVDIKSEIKSEPLHIHTASPSQSPTLDVPQKPQLTPTPTPPPQSAQDDVSTNGTTSKPSTPPPRASKKATSSTLQLISDLPVAREQAFATFREIPDNNYQYKTLGRSRELFESMTCDCTYEHGVDNVNTACGPYSDCINRLTQVECLPGDCRCRNYCRNQRFQRKEYAFIEIVLTEKKGYGLRAEEDLPKDTFIYEYVGDVVNPISFKKRMREYAQEGIQHFYFMMLQKDEFIDATKNGGIGRFANHSCNPNCYVAKWTVGDYVRMGIFAKRLIRKHEELTFNYNVDRYGHQPQICYCGEPNCVGYIGGKTQTELAAMDDLYFDALGITDEDERMELKGTKRRKGKKIDDPDFMPMMRPVIERDVPKVVQAIRQTTSRKVLYKILTRIKITEDQAALRQLMRLRGYSIMTNVLNDYREDLDLVTLAMECMSTWPLMNKNKVEDSQVYLPVEGFAQLEDEKVRILAQGLLDHWSSLPTYNRIPKRLITVRSSLDPLLTKLTLSHQAVEASDEHAEPLYGDDEDEFSRREQEMKRARMEEEEAVAQRLRLRVRAAQRREAEISSTIAQRKQAEISPTISRSSCASPIPQKEHHRRYLQEQQKIQAIITSVAEAKAAEEAAAAAEAAELRAKAEVAAANASKKKEKEKARAKKLTPEEKATKEAAKEKKLLKLVGAVVVKSMNKHAKILGKEDFKKHAKELTHLIVEKEKKSASYKESRLEALSEEKVSKIKRFCKEYNAKLLRKLEKTGKLKKHGSSKSNGHGAGVAGSSVVSSMTTPNNAGDEDGGGDGEGGGVEMSVEEAIGMDYGEGDDGLEEDAYDEEGADGPDGEDEGEDGFQTSPAVAQTPVSASASSTSDTAVMNVDGHPPSSLSWEPDRSMRTWAS